MLGPGKWALFIALAISFTSSARILPEHLVFAPLSWAFLPLWQFLWLWIVYRVLKPNRRFAELSDLYFAGHGPWLLYLLLISGLCIVAPEPWPIFEWLLSSGAMVVSGLGVILWCAWLMVAMFRAGLGLSWWRSIGYSLFFYAGYAACLTGYFVVTGQLGPIVGWAE